MKTIVHPQSWVGFRKHARICLAEGLAPAEVHFQSEHAEQTSLFAAGASSASTPLTTPSGQAPLLRLSHRFIEAATAVAVHTLDARWDLMYRIVWRLSHGEPELLQVATDDDVLQFTRLYRAVLRDVHKCHAFVRFRPVADADAHDGQHWVAWYKPDYAILQLAAPHFVERFGPMAWSILTPEESVTHRAGQTVFAAGCPRDAAPTADALEALWRVYYTNIFNPARLNRRAMLAEMPRRYWKTMPETELIDELIKDAPARTRAFLVAQPKPSPSRDEHQTLDSLYAAARQCQTCDWCHTATQVVLGAGPQTARIMLIGEQPGDQEDVQAHPFVGPAGQLLDKALAQAGINRADVFVTNAVKHFKWTPRGKRRLHQKPSATDVAACRSWLVAEMRLIRPMWVVCLGTTAALAVLGKAHRLKDVRGQTLRAPNGMQTLCTVHPSAILRTAPEAQEAAFAALVQDLHRVAQACASSLSAASQTNGAPSRAPVDDASPL